MTGNLFSVLKKSVCLLSVYKLLSLLVLLSCLSCKHLTEIFCFKFSTSLGLKWGTEVCSSHISLMTVGRQTSPHAPTQWQKFIWPLKDFVVCKWGIGEPSVPLFHYRPSSFSLTCLIWESQGVIQLPFIFRNWYRVFHKDRDLWRLNKISLGILTLLLS